MNEMQIFQNEEFGRLRTVEIDGEPWMVGKDVAEALGYSNPRDALCRHVDDEDKNTVVNPDGNRGNPNMTVINESGLYSLVMSSKLPGAKKFRRWVTSEVLPTIRKTGGFFTGSKELQAIFMLDSRTVQHEQRISALEGSMVIDYGQQRALADMVNAAVMSALGSRDCAAYQDKTVRCKAYAECNRDIQHWFRVNSRNNIPRKRVDEAAEYVQRWRPSTNLALLIQQTNSQESLYPGVS